MSETQANLNQDARVCIDHVDRPVLKHAVIDTFELGLFVEVSSSARRKRVVAELEQIILTVNQ
jgi:hypothetical protein